MSPMPPSSSAVAAGAAGDRRGDVGEVEGAGVAVDQRDAVEEERRENAPSRKYLSAASWLSSRRRRASPHSRYSGSDSTSSATNIVSRSLDAGNSIIPPTANSTSGKTSVCSSPLVDASPSASVPGSVAAWPVNALSPPSRRRSANSSTLISDSTQQHAPQ